MLSIFYPIIKSYVKSNFHVICLYEIDAMESKAVEYQQQQITLATNILRNCYLHCQNCPSLSQSLSILEWHSILVDIIHTLCVEKEDCVGVAQMWVFLLRCKNPGDNHMNVLQEIKGLTEEKTISSQLSILLYRELFLQFSFEELMASPECSMESLLQQLCQMVTNDSEEIVCIMQVGF